MRIPYLMACSTIGLSGIRSSQIYSGNIVNTMCCTPIQATRVVDSVQFASGCLDTIVQIRGGVLESNTNEKELRTLYFGNSTLEDEARVSSMLNRRTLVVLELIGIADTFSLMQANLTKKPFHCASTAQCTFPDGLHEGYAILGEIWLGVLSVEQFSAERLATLVFHELSHADYAGDTEDFGYGEDKVRRLAIEAPEKAARNADSYALYAQAVCADAAGKSLPENPVYDTTGNDDGD